jgi:hypothetical protein
LRAASTNSRFLSDKNSARIMRAIPRQLTRPIDRMIDRRLVPMIATSVSRRMNSGTV